MTKNQSLLFRVLLFLAGAGIVLIALILSTAGKELTQNDKFSWASIAVMYCVLFAPFFFSYITIGNFSVKIPRLALVWTGIIFYLVTSIIVLVLLAANIFSLKNAVIAQSVFLFVFAVEVYFAFFASQHIADGASEEKAKLDYISEIKNKAQMTAFAVHNLPSRFESEQKIILQAFESIKYISPARDSEDLELQILAALNHIAELCAATSQEGGSPSGLDNEARNLQLLVKQRKLLRN